jgi:hypothetical protein
LRDNSFWWHVRESSTPKGHARQFGIRAIEATRSSVDAEILDGEIFREGSCFVEQVDSERHCAESTFTMLEIARTESVP